MTFLAKLRQANQKRNKWLDPDGELDSLFFSNELAGEVGEACNIVKKIVRKRYRLRGNFSSATVQELENELADALICLDLLANEFEIDLEAVTKRKWNETSQKVGVPMVIV